MFNRPEGQGSSEVNCPEKAFLTAQNLWNWSEFP